MPPSPCAQIKQEYTALLAQKQEFVLKYQKLKESKDLKAARVLRIALEQARDKLKEKLWVFETELPLAELKAQYQSYADLFQKTQITEQLSTGELGVKGIDHQEYPLPQLAKIIESAREANPWLKDKFEQGLIELSMAPLASLDHLLVTYRDQLWRHYQDKKLFATMESPQDLPQFPDDLPFDSDTIAKIKSGKIKYEDGWTSTGDMYADKNSALWVWEKYKDADITGELVYFPQEFDKKPEKHQGKTKLQLLEDSQNTRFPGWLVSFHEKLPNIPRAGQGQTKGGRQQLEAGQTPNKYLQDLKDSQYQHEQGIIPEEQVIQAMKHLAETNQVLDDYAGHGSASYQLGAYFPASGYVPYAYWNRGDRQADLSWRDPEFSLSVNGARSAVRVV